MSSLRRGSQSADNVDSCILVNAEIISKSKKSKSYSMPSSRIKQFAMQLTLKEEGYSTVENYQS